MIGNRVVINRGDSWTLALDLANYSIIANTTIYFGLMDPHQPFENALVKKKIVISQAGKVTFDLKASDTLDLEPGVYFYAVKMHKVNKANNIDEVITIIDKTKFIIND